MSGAHDLPAPLRALLNRARMGMLISATGWGADRFEFWQGYARAVRQVANGSGEVLAAKDARLGGYEPLGGFEGAAHCLHIDLETLPRGDVQKLARDAGVGAA
jgi:hypothetical protein